MREPDNVTLRLLRELRDRLSKLEEMRPVLARIESGNEETRAAAAAGSGGERGDRLATYALGLATALNLRVDDTEEEIRGRRARLASLEEEA